MNIETERLNLIPLTPPQLRLWCEDMPALEKELHCSYKAEPLEGFFLEIVKGQLSITEKDAENYLWHSFWLLVRKADSIVVGSVDFKNIPNHNGEVEIGYGLGKAFEHQGYMTEAVKAMCNWGLAQTGVTNIIAETYVYGLASQRVLQRCGFSEEEQNETIWWRL